MAARSKCSRNRFDAWRKPRIYSLATAPRGAVCNISGNHPTGFARVDLSGPAGVAWRVVIAIILSLGVVSWQTAGAQRGATFDTFVGQVAPGDLVPGADRFGPTQQ